MNLDAVDKLYTPPPYTYDWSQCATYALGVGAGSDDLAYTWEGAPTFKVIPSFAVCPTLPIVSEALRDVGADLRTLVHGAQRITVHAAIASEGALHSRGRISAIYDKGKGAVVIVDTETTTAQGTPLFDTRWSIFCRGQGDFGGPRGERHVLPEAIADAAPLLDVTRQTRDDQALLYRLNGDLNPLHVDPATAERAGFRAPILHGLCTYGIATHTIVSQLCGDVPERLRSIQARFSSEVYPGDALRVTVLPTAQTRADLAVHRFTVAVGERVVLTDGVVEIAPG